MNTPLILVVDDEPLSRMVTSEFLRLAGYRVRTFGDGHPALDWMRAQPPGTVSLIVTDHDMPLSGNQWLAELQVAGPMPEVIVVTGCARADVQPLYLAFSPADILPKPLDRAALLNTVAATVGDPPICTP